MKTTVRSVTKGASKKKLGDTGGGIPTIDSDLGFFAGTVVGEK